MLSVILGLLIKLLFFSLVLLSATWSWYYWSHRHLIRAASKLPCPAPRLPILGHLHYTVLGFERMSQWILKLTIDGLNCGMTNICVWLGPVPIIVIHAPEDIQKILTSSNTLEKGDEMRYLNFFAGNGVLTAPGHIWKKSRRYIGALFRHTDHMFPEMNKNSRVLVADLSEHVGEVIDVMPLATDYTMKSSYNLIFGVDQDIDIRSEKSQDMKSNVEIATRLFVKRMTIPWLKFDAVFGLFYHKEVKDIDGKTRAFMDTHIQKMKAKKGAKHTEGNGVIHAEETTTEGPLDLLDVYSNLRSKHPEFNDEDFMREAVTILATGTDSVGLGLSCCILGIAKYPHVQERLYREILSVVGPDGNVDVGHLNNMPYLDQVFKESLRFFTVIPYILRKSAEDLQLSSCTIPADNTVIVCLRGLNMNPKLFPDPHKYDPERFSAERMEGKSKFCFLPFSAGPRNCIAKAFAVVLVKTAVVHVVRRFLLSTDMDIHNIRRVILISLMSAEGMKITVRDRS